MKVKRSICAGICLILFAMMALGSGSSGTDDKKDIITSGDQDKSGADADVTKEQQTGEADPYKGTGDSKTSVETSSNVTINEQVLVDQDGIKITATGYETDSIWGEGISLLIENNTDKDYTVGCDALIVNDYMISDLFAETVAAGKKSNSNMYLSSSQLKAAGIENVGKVEMYFHA